MSLLNALHNRSSFVFDSVNEIYITKYYCLAAATFLYYDHFLTFPQEFDQIWKPYKALTFVDILFLLNRYLNFLGYIPILVFNFDPPVDLAVSRPMCRIFIYFPGVLSCITQIILSVLLCLRSYALYGRNILIILITGSLALLSVAGSVWALTQVQPTNLNFGTASVFRICFAGSLTSDIPFKASWAAALVFDSVVSVLTVTKTLQLRKLQAALGLYSDLPTLLARDGSIYFVVMATANLINLAFFVSVGQRGPSYFEQSTGNNSLITQAITVTMTSRLILNLRDLTQPVEDGTMLSTNFSVQRGTTSGYGYDTTDASTDLTSNTNITTDTNTVSDIRSPTTLTSSFTMTMPPDVDGDVDGDGDGSGMEPLKPRAGMSGSSRRHSSRLQALAVGGRIGSEYGGYYPHTQNHAHTHARRHHINTNTNAAASTSTSLSLSHYRDYRDEPRISTSDAETLNINLTSSSILPLISPFRNLEEGKRTDIPDTTPDANDSWLFMQAEEDIELTSWPKALRPPPLPRMKPPDLNMNSKPLKPLKLERQRFFQDRGVDKSSRTSQLSPETPDPGGW